MSLIKYVFIPLFTLLSACSSKPIEQPRQETRECMNYRGMMTAPMAPDAMQRLKEACDKSAQR